MQARGAKDLFYAVGEAKKLLQGNQRSGCQSLVILITDGLAFTPGARCKEAYPCQCSNDGGCKCCGPYAFLYTEISQIEFVFCCHMCHFCHTTQMT